jgi:hypothetical protein
MRKSSPPIAMSMSRQHPGLSMRSPLATTTWRPEWCCSHSPTCSVAAESTKLWVELELSSTAREQPLMITDTYIVCPERG